MKVVVATVNYLLFANLDTCQVSIIESNRPEYYGISWWQNCENLILSHSGIKNDSLLALADYANSENGYLSDGKKVSPRFLSQPHQIICANNNWIIATNTGRNCVTVYDPQSEFFKEIRVNDIRWDRLSKHEACGEHFNSVFLSNKKLYVLAHGFNKGAYILEYSYPDCALIAKYPIPSRTGMHNIWVDEAGNMFTCHSDTGQLIEAKSNESVWSAGHAFYSRGLAATKDLIIIGDSKITSRENRANSASELWLVDRKTFNTIERIQLGQYGSVHEVRILDECDLAHHGIIFPNIAKLEEQCNEYEKIIRHECKTEIIPIDPFLRQFKLIAGFFTKVNDWYSSRENSLVLALSKKLYSNNFKIELDYKFDKDSELNDQHISIIFGYKGYGDSNMLALLVYYNKANDLANLSLMKNMESEWQLIEVLIPSTLTEGKLELIVNSPKIEIKCNDIITVENIDPDLLETVIKIV